jgi:hypothetical protein
VLLADGSQLEISQLAAGDLVRCGLEKNAVAPVDEVLYGTGSRWAILTFDDDLENKLTLTDEHLVWVDGKGWTAAKNLVPGDPVFTADGLRIKVNHVELVEEELPFVSLRLREDAAVYANGILVHDQCGWWTPPAGSTEEGEVVP